MFNPALHFRVELNLADGTYELHPAPEEDPAEEQLYPGEGEPEPAQDPEDPQAFSEGKPRCMNSLFYFHATY